MDSLDDKINEIFTPENIQALKEELKNDTQDPGKDQQPKKRRGRPNKNRTALSRIEENKKARETYHYFMDLKSPDNFNQDIVERVQGEIINDSELDSFRELYQLTIETIWNEFKENNPELIKKHPYNWFKPLLLEIKKNVKKISADDIEKCFVVWDCLSELLYSIGLYPTYELFQFMTNIYKPQLKKKVGVNPLYASFIEKINSEADGALINEIATCPYNSTNKIFLAKVHGIVEKTEPKQIEVFHSIRNYDTLPMFSNEKTKDQ